MPRPPKFIHPLRALRVALKKTQPQFGRMIGVSGETVKSIEIGRLHVSPDIYFQVLFSTGVSLRGATVKSGALMVDGKRFTPPSEPVQIKITPAIIDSAVEAISGNMRALLTAAAATEKYFPVFLAAEEAAFSLAERYGLRAAAARLAKQAGVRNRPNWTSRAEEFRSILISAAMHEATLPPSKRSSARASKAKA